MMRQEKPPPPFFSPCLVCVFEGGSRLEKEGQGTLGGLFFQVKVPNEGEGRKEERAE